MDSYLCVNIPIKMIAYTDLDGKITPMRFQFTDADGSLVTVKIDRILSSDQPKSKIGATFECASTMYGVERRFKLYYSSMSRRWCVERIG